MRSDENNRRPARVVGFDLITYFRALRNHFCDVLVFLYSGNGSNGTERYTDKQTFFHKLNPPLLVCNDNGGFLMVKFGSGLIRQVRVNP